MNKKTLFGILGAILLLSLSLAGIANAYRGDYTQQGPNYSDERHSSMTSAFEANDYYAWKSLMMESGRSPKVLDLVTEDNFDLFVEARDAALSGDFEKSAELRAELGLGQGHKGMGKNGQHKQANFIDSNLNGVCDNQE